MIQIFMIGAGGALGAICRYALGSYISSLVVPSTFPFATFTINLLGSFLIGIIAYLIDKQLLISQELTLFLTVGFLAAFTTFSTYSVESFRLLEQGHIILMVINIIMQTTLGIIAVMLSYTGMGKFFST